MVWKEKGMFDVKEQFYNHFISTRRPDMIVIDKEHHECQIIDFAILHDTRAADKKVEKIEKYLDLARELKKVWNMQVAVVPLVVRSSVRSSRYTC